MLLPFARDGRSPRRMGGGVALAVLFALAGLVLATRALGGSPPPTPAGLQVTDAHTPAGGTLVISWTPNAGADTVAYAVYRDTSPAGGFSAGVGTVAHPTATLTDTGLLNGVTYWYRVTARSVDGLASAPSALASGHPTDATPPAAPSGLTVTDLGTGELDLAWTASGDSDVVGYWVYRATSPGPFARLTPAPVTVTRYVDVTVAVYTPYVYQVTAVDTSGNASAPSAPATGVATDRVPPGQPQGLTARDPGVGRRIDLSWAPNSDRDLAGYELYRDTDAAFKSPVKLNATLLSGTAHADLDVKDGTTYSYYLVAVDRAGNRSPASAPASATPTDVTPPALPAGLQARDLLTGSEVELRWTPNAESDLAGYNLYRDARPDGPFGAKLTPRPLTSPVFRDTGLTVDQAVYYRIEALDVTGNKSPLSAPVGVTPTDKTPPAPPAAPQIKDLLTGTALDLSWAASTEADLAGYNLYQATAPAGPWTRRNDPLLTANARKEKRLPRGLTYYYRLTAMDTHRNESSPSPVASIRPVDKTPPRVPQMLGVADPGTGHDLIVSWTHPGDDDLAGFHLDQAANAGGPWTRINPALLTATDWRETRATLGGKVWYRVTAVDKDGNESPPSSPAWGRASDRTPPAAPTGVRTIDTGRGGELRIEWDPGPEPDIDGYHVWYSPDPKGLYLRANFSLIRGTSFTVTGLVNGRTYWFRVSAVDRYGNESPRSRHEGSVLSASQPGVRQVARVLGASPLTLAASGAGAAAAGTVDATAGTPGTPTDQTPPRVVATDPPDNAAKIGTTATIRATFDDEMDPASIDATTFTVATEAGAPVTATAIGYDAGTRTASFSHAALQVSTKYVVALTTGVKNSSGIAMTAPYRWSYTTGTSAYTIPHGDYSSNTGVCASCHNTHTAVDVKLVVKSTESDTCFYCHDGTQAQSNIKAQFTGAPSGSNTVFHPVKDVPAVGAGAFKCSGCHNPHGDKDPTGGMYARLLRARDAAGTPVYSGNAFCLTCHGATDRQWTPAYYASTAGDHTNAAAAHYNTSFAALMPASGTKVTCVQCHNQHGAPFNDLLRQQEEAVCLSCHNTGANSMSGRNVQAEFNQTGSRHEIFAAAGSGTKVECSSCHGPHTVSNAKVSGAGTASDLSNPDNTKQDIKSAYPGLPAYQQTTKFCLACHDGAPPAAATSAQTVVPHTVQTPPRTVTPNAGGGGADLAQRGWNKGTYLNSAHYTRAQIGCDSCHESHGSPYPNLLSRPEDTATTYGVCGKCHAGQPGSPPTAPNVWPDLTRTGTPSPDRYRHPTLYKSGKHSDTENYAQLYNPATYPNDNRHAECVDCHDPHNEQPGVAQPPAAPGPLRNVSGVAVTWGTVTWNQWNPTGSDPTKPTQPAINFVNPISNQYELCFKCHSSYAWGDTPPTPGGSITQTDTPREFNPNNPSYHAVAGASKIPTFTYNGQTYRYGKFTAPTTDPATKDSLGNAWTAASRLYCEDCHRSGADNVRGPHGSNYWYILRAPWTRNTGAEGIGGTGGVNTQDHLCFKCHDYNFYASGTDQGSATVRSQFSGAGFPYNLHARHKERGCTSCHVAVPHGWKIRSLLADKGPNGDPAAPSPYYDGSYLIINTWRNAGNWQENDCDHTHA